MRKGKSSAPHGLPQDAQALVSSRLRGICSRRPGAFSSEARNPSSNDTSLTDQWNEELCIGLGLPMGARKFRRIGYLNIKV